MPAAIVVIAAVVVCYFAFFAKSTDSVINNAIANVGGEVAKRVEGTPLKALGMLAGSGRGNSTTTVNVNFGYRNTWSDNRVDGSVGFTYSLDDLDFALDGDISVYDAYRGAEQRVAFEAFLNKERFAVGSKLLDNNYYGIRFSTFSDDIRAFASKVGMDQFTINSMIEMVGMIENSLNFSSSGSGSFDSEKYSKLLS